ncbi:hypothetical protein [Acinetobacter boissieri]|uniref:Uncharacterized protein n=1 Tax=Acinetobacter boissieri TaxID=1219383 RepID=A0A1G6GS49_9GAMM|nr:hypothetical protein [Acinetobacter boissieri]SDB84764.1 hypothetical protein SAMN05421733_102106 [Acinetobacter boissieri]
MELSLMSEIGGYSIIIGVFLWIRIDALDDSKRTKEERLEACKKGDRDEIVFYQAEKVWRYMCGIGLFLFVMGLFF